MSLRKTFESKKPSIKLREILKPKRKRSKFIIIESILFSLIVIFGFVYLPINLFLLNLLCISVVIVLMKFITIYEGKKENEE